jgi:hypothetical protein
MEVFVAILAVAVAAFGLYVLARRRRMLLPEEPVEAEPTGDPYAGRPVKVKRGPGSRSGAAAVEEPDEDDPI